MEITSEQKNQLLEVLKCPLCNQLLYQPVTLFCQDTFCQTCLIKEEAKQSQQKHHKCPLCYRQYFRPPITNFKLFDLIEKVFSQEIAHRKEEMEKEPPLNEKENLKEEIIKSSWRDIINKKKSTGNGGTVQLNTDIFFLPINTNTIANQYLNNQS